MLLCVDLMIKASWTFHLVTHCSVFLTMSCSHWSEWSVSIMCSDAIVCVSVPALQRRRLVGTFRITFNLVILYANWTNPFKMFIPKMRHMCTLYHVYRSLEDDNSIDHICAYKSVYYSLDQS